MEKYGELDYKIIVFYSTLFRSYIADCSISLRPTHLSTFYAM